MKLQNAFLFEQNTKVTLGKLFSKPFHGELLSKVNKLQRHCERHFLILKRDFQDLVQKHAELDEAGKVKEPQGAGSFTVKPDSQPEWNREMATLMAKSFEVDNFDKIPLQKLLSSGLELASQDIQNLEPILSGLDFEIED